MIRAESELHGKRPRIVNLHVRRVWTVLWGLAAPWMASSQDLSSILKGVENRYNRAQTIQVFFDQTFTAQGRPQRRETGQLYLRKPGRMRWEYSSPPGKLFVSDGKEIYLYSPATHRVERARVKESDDLRAPLGFLLGRLDFWRDFQKFVHRPEGEDVRITAHPKSERAYYQEVEFVVTPERQIRYLKVLGQDYTVMEFRFADERVNVPLPEKLFRFVPPPGAEIVDAISEGGTR